MNRATHLFAWLLVGAAALSGCSASNHQTVKSRVVRTDLAPTVASVARDAGRTVSAGGLTVTVPASWIVTGPTTSACHDQQEAPIVVVADWARYGCGLYDRHRALFMQFGSGGWAVYGATDLARQGLIHGVRVQELLDNDGSGNTELTVVFPRRSEFLDFLLPRRRAAEELVEAHRVIATIRLDPTHPVPRLAPITQRFVGRWWHHDATFTVRRGGTAVASYRGGCVDGTGEEVDHFEWHRSHTSSRMRAVVTAVTCRTAHHGTVDLSGRRFASGSRFVFEFLAPGLILQIGVHNSQPGGSWCGRHIAEKYGLRACGA